MTDLKIQSPDGEFSAYLAVPENQNGPGILMIQEMFGVNQDMRDHCDAMAKQGYFALCPDLYWRLKPGVQLTDQSNEEWKQASELYQAIDVDKAIEDLQICLSFLRDTNGCTGKIGSIGFCLGGLLAYLMATRTSSDCNIGYYGVGIEAKLEEAVNINKPMMLHIAEEDKFVSKEVQQKIKSELMDNPNITVHSYAGMDHAFARHKGIRYDATAAKLANQRSAELFSANLW